MKYFLRSGLLCLFSFSMMASSQGTEIPWDLSWPFFENALSPHGIFNGYGDWCIIDEGPHPGLDFAADSSDSVIVPTNLNMVSLGSRDYPNNDQGCAMVIAPSIVGSPPYWGWGLVHLDIEDPGDQPFTHNSPLTGRQPLAPCYQYDWSPGNPAPVHLHLGWIDCVPVSYPPYIVPQDPPFEGYYNPFEYFEDDLSTYDEIQFKKVHFEGFNNTGAWFMPDGTETAEQISALTNYQVFQDFVSGAIDIAVSPFSAFQGLSDRDSAGVYSISYEILRQDPHSLDDYSPAAPGFYGERFLMQMRDEELPYGDSDEFRAIFLDGHLTDGTNPSPPAFCLGENAYIVTNSGALDTLNWQTGWDNVYTDQGYENDWEVGICQGAWDTFLAEPEITGKPSSNREAFFPDGRYAVEVTAVSHGSSGSRTEGSMLLPADDLGSSSPDTAGIIVDNFLPGGGAMIIYTSEYVGDSDSVDVKYIGVWEDDGKDDSGNSASLEYLEELREDLRFFQELEQIEEADEILLPPSLQIYEERFNSFPARSHEESFVNSGLDMSNAVPIYGIRHSNSEFSNTDYGFSLSGDAGQDPVEFLLEEIARVEGEMDYRGGNRNFHRSVYGYIPGERDGEILNMLVIYSEPTMIENSSGAELTDIIWMNGFIADMEYWDSREHGTFVRDTPSGNAEQVDILQNVLEENFPEEPDASYAVHYTFVGDLPSEYSGKIQIHIGKMYPADNEGPRDLAGHKMDAYPITVPATRRGYESWNWDRSENNRPFYPQGYEPGPDLSYHWGRPWWGRNGNTAMGHVGSDIVAEVRLNPIGLEEAFFFGSCFYRCGFWMYHDEPGFHHIHIPIVKPDGSVLSHIFFTTFPVFDPGGAGFEEPFWIGGPSTIIDNVVSSDSRCFWMTGSECNVNSHHSEALAYCVDSETSGKWYRLCMGWCTGTDQTDLQFDCCTAYIDKIYNSGEALVCYFICLGPDQYIEEYIILHPPDDGAMNIIEEPSSPRQSTVDTVIDDESLMVLSNPIRETLDVIVFGESGERWKFDIYDISGRRAVSESGVFRDDSSVLNINVENLPSGVYMLKTEVGGNEEVRSISIVH